MQSTRVIGDHLAEKYVLILGIVLQEKTKKSNLKRRRAQTHQNGITLESEGGKIVKGVLKKTASILLSASLLTGSWIGSFPVNAQSTEKIQQEFYVSVTGNDNGDGSKENPFATLERARQAVDAVNDNMTGNIIVNVGAGDYYLDQTIQFGPSDSGTNGYDVIYRSSDGLAKARIIGGKKVSGWTLADESDEAYDLDPSMIGKVYKLQLDENTPEFNTLYINGERATMARTLNKEDNQRFQAAKDEYIYATGGQEYGISFPSGSIPQEQIDAIKAAISRGEEGCQVYGWDWDYRNWFSSTIPVTGINGNTLTFTPDPDCPVANRPKYTYGSGARFFLQGNLSFLDVPGEYHYNKKTHTLYYYPKEGEENLNEQEVIVPTIQEIFRLEGNEKEVYASEPKAEDMVRNITFEGLEVGYTEFTDSYSSGWNAFDGLGVGEFPEEALQEGITQPSYCEQTERVEFRKGAFTLLQTSNITMDSLRIVNTGLTGVTAWGDNDHITIQNSELAHLGLHGINIDGGYPGPDTGKYSYNHLVTNNVIHDMGELVGHGTGLQVLQVHDSEFSHMEMYNSPRRAIFLSGAWANRVEQDSGFVRYRDAHTYNNRLEYLYLHDLQQDGGDDGAIFFSTLYGSWGDTSGYKNNYLNQVYMDRVGSAPSNRDFKPNGINFDMGCQGTVATNIKIVNPQHYNVRFDENTNHVQFDNVNLAYYQSGSSEAQAVNYKNFDDSKMEYDKIGVTAEYPYERTSIVAKEYEDVYYREEFDNGLDDWWKLAGDPETSPVYFSDVEDFIGNSFLADAFYNSSSEGCLIGKPFGTDLNKVVEIDFFDHTCDGMENGYCGMSFQYKLNSFARVDNGTREMGIGVNSDVNEQYYAYKIGSITKVTDIRREYGWHTFKWDYTSGTDAKMYIDGKLIATVPGTSFNYIEMGDYGMGGFNAYDNVVIYGGAEAPDPIPLPEQPEPDPGEEEEKKELPGRIEAEDADSRTGNTQIESVPGGGKALSFLSVGDVYQYEVEVTEDCTLPLVIGYAGNGQADLKFTIGDQTLEVNMPHTGGWTSYGKVETEPVTLKKGTYTVKIEVVNNNFNFDYFAFEEAVKVEAVIPSVNDGRLILAKGDEVKVPCQIQPTNADNQNLIWSTDNDGSVITVEKDGTIKAIGEGVATVTVKSEENNETSASFEVEVQDAERSLVSTTEKGCVPSSENSGTHPNYQPDKLIDGDISKGWCCATSSEPGYSATPAAFLNWENGTDVRAIYIYDIAEGGNYVEKMEVIFDGDEENKIVLENGVPDGGLEKIVLDEVRENVKQIEFRILKGQAPYTNYGFGEIKVFSEIPGEVPVNSVTFGADQISVFEGDTVTLNPATAVPSSATNRALDVKIISGEDVISMKSNIVDGILRNYTITGLKEGKAVIRATAENGVYGEITVVVGSVEALGDLIIRAEELYSRYPGESSEQKAFKAAIDNALKVYNNSKDVDEISKAVSQLEEAMKAFEEALENPVQDIEEVLNSLTVEQPEKGDTRLSLPEVPLGYRIEIAGTEPANVISSNGTISIPDEDVNIKVTFRVTRVSDGVTADRTIDVMVPGYSAQEVMETVSISSPAKGENVSLPTVPHGFSISIIASTDDLVAEDGTVKVPLTDTSVTVTVQVTKLSNDTSVQKDFEIVLLGVEKKLNVEIEANEIDAVKGPYIVVKNNEVSNFNGGDWIRYDYVNFGDTPKNIRFHINTAVHPNWAGKKIHVMLDDPTSGTNLGTVTVEAAGNDWGIYGWQEIDLTEAVSGVHTVYLVGEGGEGIGGVKEIMFEDITPVETMYQVTVENGSGSGDYKAGAEVTITADEAPEGQVFDKWVSDDVTFADAESETITFVMPEKDVTVTAVYREAADKTLLQKTYDYALTLKTEGVAESAVKFFNQAMDNAKAVLDDPKATQEEVKAAWDELLEGIWGLGITQGDKTQLELLIEKAEEMMNNADKYVETNWQELVDALAEAQKVMDDGDALEEDVEAAAEALNHAILIQRYKANKENLKDLINKANEIDLSQYTAESVAVFQAALKNANLVLADESLSEDDQGTVDQAVEELAAAIENLSVAEENPSNPSDPDDGTETPSTPDQGEEGTETPPTGDSSSTVVSFTAILAVMMLAALMVMRRKRKVE